MIFLWDLKLINQLIIKRKLNKNVIIHFYRDNHVIENPQNDEPHL